MARERARPTEVELPLEYTNATQRAQIPFNLDGWLEDGRTLASIAAFVRDPECLILELAPAGDEPLPLAAYDCIRAKIGLEFLQRESLVQTTNGVRILFSGPKRARYQRGYQVAFIALVPREKLSLGESPFRLHRIAWRRDMLAPSNAIKSDTRTDPNGDEL
ncbi:MAG: hypothetical protein NZ739_12155 [Verrucomicrobiae bacterium]|nr:hypothetical protein [Verrucomicrobiae bacterium]